MLRHGMIAGGVGRCKRSLLLLSCLRDGVTLSTNGASPQRRRSAIGKDRSGWMSVWIVTYGESLGRDSLHGAACATYTSDAGCGRRRRPLTTVGHDRAVASDLFVCGLRWTPDAYCRRMRERRKTLSRGRSRRFLAGLGLRSGGRWLGSGRTPLFSGCVCGMCIYIYIYVGFEGREPMWPTIGMRLLASLPSAGEKPRNSSSAHGSAMLPQAT